MAVSSIVARRRGGVAWAIAVVPLVAAWGSTTMLAQAGTHGPVCIVGEWPDVMFTPGSPFEVGGAP